jgi:nitronate monooxygenase
MLTKSPSRLAELTKGRLSLPLIGAPMFIVSGPELVIAQCKAGIIGSFPALNARPQGVLDDWLARIKEELAAHDRAHPGRPAAPFAVNQIVHKSNKRIEDDLALCVKHKAPIVITSLGAREEVNAAVHSYGGLVMHDVIDAGFARKAIEKGADGLIAVATGAGGHAGRVSPFALVQEIRDWWTGPLALSGAISTGRAVLAARAIGANFAYAGSMFIATHEANAVESYKQMIVRGFARDIVYTDLFTGIHANYLRGSVTAAGLDPDNLPRPDGGLDFSQGESYTKAWRDIWGAGQGIGAVKNVQSIAELVSRLRREYDEAQADLGQAAHGRAV